MHCYFLFNVKRGASQLYLGGAYSVVAQTRNTLHLDGWPSMGGMYTTQVTTNHVDLITNSFFQQTSFCFRRQNDWIWALLSWVVGVNCNRTSDSLTSLSKVVKQFLYRHVLIQSRITRLFCACTWINMDGVATVAIGAIASLKSPRLAEHQQESCSYRKDDRAMCPIHGCPEKFRESLNTSAATFPEIFNGLLFRSILRMCTQNLKFVALPLPEITGGTQKWAVPGYAYAPFFENF